jgi:dipeptidyl aminopeptidase/acylaminoacyl peptidase
MKPILSLLIVILTGCIGVFLLQQRNIQISPLIDNQKRLLNNFVATPTPLPFHELTIPYLREREYKSALNDLEFQYEGSNYTAYLASYDSDGFKVNGLLTQPKGDRPKEGWPAIVFLHGYIPPRQYQTMQQYYDYVDYLARNGFVVFKIDLRGHANSEGQAGGGYFGSDYIVDTLNAYAALQSSEFVNPQRIGLWGHSMAGNILLRSFAVRPKIPAVVIWAGAVYSYADREKYGISDTSFQPSANPTGVSRRQRLTDLYGEASKGHEFWDVMAPTNFLTDLKGALQIHHAVNDNVVNIGYSRDLVSLLKDSSVQYELYEYQDGGHNILGAAFDQAMQRTVEFFQKHLR